ncbi:UDP-Gal or UDP-GlcNAc-dependent glycosyltransferase [Trypanosoma theileri]|uniref:Hexosyltransferase n=1 Tax=Trypanosoma theileri TaxID=67003 RepID=A0A1X0NJ70_9TRYP|nr:UDP-Gal or UDP-GlcNAc-dependent glycosyltransferase [Trypanosoma theileri]ORC84785.1 UDP-Gal or UDP-GlcNAc-dependent glycosyltransferase [Trypanosoma theileri]
MKRITIPRLPGTGKLFLIIVAIGTLYLLMLLIFSPTTQFMGIRKVVSVDDIAVNVTGPILVDKVSLSDALRYIPHSTVQTWKERDYLIVFGIPSMDVDGRRRRRYLQRTTCWQFPGVATRSNNFTGSMLVLYVLARHPSKGYEYSAPLVEEANEYHDVITFPTNEGVSNTNKLYSGGGFWGVEAEIAMSRKTYLWLELALRLFPNTSYITKADDDMFLRVPQFLVDLRTLPRHGIYWGNLVWSNYPKRFVFIVGFCMTVSRDVAEQVVSYKPLQDLVRLPYSKEREAEFLSLNMDHEDVLVGRVLYELQYTRLLYVSERKCRFHDIVYGPHYFPLSGKSVLIHHIKEHEYAWLMWRFNKSKIPIPVRYRVPPHYKRKRNRIQFDC